MPLDRRAAGDALDAGASGASAMTLAQTSLDGLRLIVAAASTVSGDGRADTVDVTAVGASSVDLLGVTSRDAVVHAEGASPVNDVASTLEAHASGASTVPVRRWTAERRRRHERGEHRRARRELTRRARGRAALTKLAPCQR